MSYNLAHGILFFRLPSQLIPFASHPRCTVRWQKIFAHELAETGRFVRKHAMRIDMHPDQFIIINPIDTAILKRSVAELEYHVRVLDLMGLDQTAKVEIHGGGTYKDKNGSMRRFAKNYAQLPSRLRRRLAVENDERSYSLADCLQWHEETGIPVVFDTLHHILFGNGRHFSSVLSDVKETWGAADGLPIIHYSSQERGARRGSHAAGLDPADFSTFLEQTRPCDFDLMLEIKDKELSACRALELAAHDPRLQTA